MKTNYPPGNLTAGRLKKMIGLVVSTVSKRLLNMAEYMAEYQVDTDPVGTWGFGSPVPTWMVDFYGSSSR